MRRLLLAVLTLLLATGAAAPAAAQDKRIALSFDDVPRAQGAFLTPDARTAMLIAALKRAGVRQAAFFVTPGNLATASGTGGEKRIAAYVAAGHVIADHSFSHRHLSAIGADADLADIDRAEAWLAGRPGRRPWFRYPYLDEGGSDKQVRDAMRAGLAARGLSDGYVTIDGLDWKIEELTLKARAAGTPIDRTALRDFYVETMVGAADYFDGLARRTLGRSPAHVMLMHETDLAALYVGDLVRALRRDGWRIVTADAAYADPVSAEAARYDTPSAQGTLTEMLAWQKGIPAPRWYPRNNERVMERLFAERVLHQEPAP